MNSKKIYVTRPNLPPLESFLPSLEAIWSSRVLTNNGEFHQQFEKALAERLLVKNLALYANGTLALVSALQAMRITGEVITTPYSFVATSHSLLWNNLEPVFVDVDPITLNIDPARIEEAITPKTTAILPVHCYGRPADVDRIQKLADIYGLKVIYDAAHAFGVTHNGRGIMDYGDLSVISMHATKVFNTFEGGAIACRDHAMYERLGYLKNFGFADETTVMASGINGKMSEFNAALGLLQLNYIDEALARRKQIDARYRDLLAGVDGIELLSLPVNDETNCAYFPIFVKPGFALSRDALYARFREQDIYTRRYFYPLISNLPMYRGKTSSDPENLPIANAAADQVLCLPIYPDLTDDDVDVICDLIRNVANG